MMEYRRLLEAASSVVSQLRVVCSIDCKRPMGVSAAVVFATLTFDLASSLMLGLDLDAEVSFFTTAVAAAMVEEAAGAAVA